MLKNTRDVYEQIIKGMPVMNLFLYSCDFGETSGDDSRSGGFYSSALLDVCHQQARENHNLGQCYYLSAANAHELAKPIVKRKKNNQNPQIEKPRSGPYLPLAIV